MHTIIEYSSSKNKLLGCYQFRNSPSQIGPFAGWRLPSQPIHLQKCTPISEIFTQVRRPSGRFTFSLGRLFADILHTGLVVRWVVLLVGPIALDREPLWVPTSSRKPLSPSLFSLTPSRQLDPRLVDILTFSNFSLWVFFSHFCSQRLSTLPSEKINSL